MPAPDCAGHRPAHQRVRLRHLHTFAHYLARHGAIPSILTRRRLGHCLGNHQSDAAYSLDTSRAPHEPGQHCQRQPHQQQADDQPTVGVDLPRPRLCRDRNRALARTRAAPGHHRREIVDRAAGVISADKNLAGVERDFKSLKAIDIFQSAVRGHIQRI